MPLIKIESYKSENYMIISSSEYNDIRNQLDRMYKISYALFDAYYGKDYYLPISASDADVYEYLAHELIKDLEKRKRKRNIFYKIWEKIKNPRMKKPTRW